MVINFLLLFESTVTSAATETLGKKRSKKKPWITNDIFELCDERRELKQKKKVDNHAKAEYSKINKKIKKSTNTAKEKWVQQQCENIESDLATNNTKKAYETVKALPTKSQHKVSTIKDKNGNTLTDTCAVHERWTEYC